MNVFTLIFYFYSLLFISKGSTPNKAIDAKTIYNSTFTSESLRKYVDTTVEPCDNFYNFACGNWIKDKKSANRYLIGNFDYRPTRQNFKSFIEETRYHSVRGESPVVDKIIELRDLCVGIDPFDAIGDCERVVIEFGTYALSTLFIKRNRKNSEERNDYIVLDDMIKRIKEEFILLIDERQDTFDELSIDNIFLKFTNMTFSIKSDDFGLTNVTLMEECYKNIGINYNDTIENIVNAIKHQQSITKSDDKMWFCREKIFKPAEYLNFHVYSSAKYHSKYNKIYISSDTLAEPSFSIKFPSALNYGYLGFTFAQAILDAFDTKTINHNYDNFDSEEGKKSVVSEESMNHMIAISTCFTQEWFKQRETINHRDVDNILTTDRKIVDNAGLKIAYEAYRNFVRSFGKEYIVVPGFEQYTEDQLFFIGFGRHFCEYTSEDSYVPHNGKPGDILSEIRTNSILKNYHEFSNTFYCSYNNKLMYTKTCKVW